MAKKSKASKAVIASLLATSAIVPAMAVSADVDGSLTVNGTDATTRTGEAVTTSTEVPAVQTIDFTVADESNMLARFVKGPGTLMERNGQKYIQLDLAESVLGMLKSVTVGEASALHEFGGKKMVLIPVTADYAAVEVVFNIDSPFAKGEYKATLTPDAVSIKNQEETKPTEEKPAEPAKVFEQGKEFGQIADGEYAVDYDAYKTDDGSNKGNYAAITNHFEAGAELVVADGVYTVQLPVKATSKEMVAGLKVAGQDATFNEEAQVYEFTIDSLSDLHEAAVHVVVAAANMDKWYPFGFAIETAELELPEVAAKAETMPLHVYKDGTNEYSIMQNLYTDDEIKVTATPAGYAVDVTFPQGQHLNSFTVAGATVAEKSKQTVGNNTVKVYTVTVKDLSTIYTATADLTVRLNGTVLYDTDHTLQLQFGGKKNPFTDIQKAGNYGAIVQLYSQGIFKEAAKFNPNNTVKRSQFALMLNRALDLQVPATTAFTDIAKYDAEAQNAIKALNNYGVINGTSATTFAPASDITRKNAALMIYRLLVKEGYTATGAALPFKDVPATDKEAAVAIAELNKLGIMTGNNGEFKPSNKLTRNQMAKVLNNALVALEDLK